LKSIHKVFVLFALGPIAEYVHSSKHRMSLFL